MCLFPTRASQEVIEDKKTYTRLVFGRPSPNPEGDLLLPCGRCDECIQSRASSWATRCQHEMALHADNCFITLTYNQETVPSIHDIKPEFQKFIKRLRKKIKKPIRYIVSHEYGSTTFRPHHHAIIFGWTPSNWVFLKNSPTSGCPLFTSGELTQLWGLGHTSVGVANSKTAYYIAKYALKGKKHTFTDPKTSEIVSISDCMDVSKRPAIGVEYFLQNADQLVASGDILPRYYLKLLSGVIMPKNLLDKLKQLNPTLHERYDYARSKKLSSRSSQERLSKYIISKQKKDQASEFRDAPSVHMDEYLDQLTYERDSDAEFIRSLSKKD